MSSAFQDNKNIILLKWGPPNCKKPDQLGATYVRKKLQAMVPRAPQVVVKLVRAPKGMKGISNNLTYISRDGQLEIEDQDGQVIQGKEAVADLKAEWRDGGMPIAADSTMRDAFHLVLSMPTRTDPLSVHLSERSREVSKGRSPERDRSS